MDGGLYERDFFTWTRRQAEALRRLAERREDLDADLDLAHLIEEVEDLGSEQVHAVMGNLGQMLRHLLLLAVAPDDSAAGHWRGEAVAFRGNAAERFLPSMRRVAEPRLDRTWRTARRTVEAKLGRSLAGLPGACPFALDELLDEEAPLDPLIARLRPPEG